jgi:hypothetical protein
MWRGLRRDRLIGASVLAVTFLAGGCPAEDTLVVTPDELNFGVDGVQQTLSISSMAGTLGAWTIQTNAQWIDLSARSGTGATMVTVTILRENAPPGDHIATLTIDSNVGRVHVDVRMKDLE